jgi:haloacetate dehalogenase
MPKSSRRDLIKKAAVLGLGVLGAEDSLLIAGKLSGPMERLRGSVDFFPGFKRYNQATSGAVINFVTGGKGPGLLLLHGYPQTHIMWRKIAPHLSDKFTLVIPDLRGYGDSSKPADGDNHFAYSKRAMAQDLVELMLSRGFTTFAVAGHDRGGRVAHRMALDHPDAVTKAVFLDIVPTYTVYHAVTKEVATVYFHWFFLIQPAPFPETLIGNNVEFYLKAQLLERVAPGAVEEQAFAEYLRCFRDPAMIHGICEDYRAGASVDLDHDAADLDRKISCPVRVLWAQQGAFHRLFDVLGTWRERASNVSGRVLPGGHYLPEEQPDSVVEELRAFLS